MNLFLKNCSSLKQLQQIHAHSIIQSLFPNLQALSCKILNLYSQLSSPTQALNVFKQIPHPDLITLTTLINLYIQSHQPLNAMLVFANVLASRRILDGYVFVGALTACGQIDHLGLGKSVHGLVLRHGLGLETVVNNALISMYCRNGRISSARVVFNTMCVKDLVSWSSMLRGCFICGCVECACKLFDEMPQRDVVSWTVMITGLVQGKYPVCALEMFQQMKLEGCCATLLTIVAALSACADVGASDLGRAIHGYIAKLNLGLDVTVVCNALVDMYSKSGDLGMADKIFKGMAEKDVYSWTSMIMGFAVHGDGKRATEVLTNMLDSRIRPNEVTFLAVLLACSHSGLVDDGRIWFKKMREVYKLVPKIEHYGCMVDLLGRAGHLKEAEKLIQEMSTKPDVIIWRSLLSVSLAHGDIELAETAGREIVKQEPDDDGVYMLLWNMYASSNRWEEALAMRRKVKYRKVMKRPGFSWIELDGVGHEFLIEDRMHTLQRDIYLILDRLAEHLKTDSTSILENDSICE